MGANVSTIEDGIGSDQEKVLSNTEIINLTNGKKFTLIAHHSSPKNKYIQSAKLNGKILDTPWFSHKDLMNGGTLLLEMGERPGKIWGGGVR